MKNLFYTLLLFTISSTVFTSCKEEICFHDEGTITGKITTKPYDCPDCQYWECGTPDLYNNNNMELNLKKTILPPTCDGYFREVEIFITEKTTEFSYDKVIEHGKSNFDGTYTFQLVPGEYSLFVKNEMGQIIPSSYTYSPNYYYPDFSINESEITVKDIQLCESLIYVTH